MNFGARVVNTAGSNDVTLRAGDRVHAIEIPPKPEGHGSSASGAELLFLALATCYCNDIYREAAKTGIDVQRVEVEVRGEFTAEGEPASGVKYSARVTSNAPVEAVRQLMAATDRVAEIQNTLWVETPVRLAHIEAVSP